MGLVEVLATHPSFPEEVSTKASRKAIAPKWLDSLQGEDRMHPPNADEVRMARVTVEDCLDKVGNRFALVILAAERARQLAKGARPLVQCDNKPAVSALREIADARVKFNESVTETVETFLKETRARGLIKY